MEGSPYEAEIAESDSETVQSSSTVENSIEQQNSSQQEQQRNDSNNAADEDAGNITSYDQLSIITARPKRVEYAHYAKRLESFKTWPKNLHMKPEDLAKAGFFYGGYGDCVRCFFCGGGLRNWEPEDDVWVEHARLFPKCAFLLQEVGKDLIDTVEVLSRESETNPIKYSDVIRRLQDSGLPTPLELKERSVARDPAVLSLVDNGFDEDHIIQPAQELRKSGELISSDKLYEAAKARNFPRKECCDNLGGDSVSLGGGDENHDKEIIEILRKENSELRHQTTCKICWENEVAILFLPCGHLVSCIECSHATIACPVCRADIKGIVRAYITG